MKKLGLILSLIGFSVMLGAGLTVMMAGDAQAVMCSTYDRHGWDTGMSCGCNDGRVGTVIVICAGYFPDGSDCNCYSYCSPCPPKYGDELHPAIQVPFP